MKWTKFKKKCVARFLTMPRVKFYENGLTSRRIMLKNTNVKRMTFFSKHTVHHRRYSGIISDRYSLVPAMMGRVIWKGRWEWGRLFCPVGALHCIFQSWCSVRQSPGLWIFSAPFIDTFHVYALTAVGKK